MNLSNPYVALCARAAVALRAALFALLLGAALPLAAQTATRNPLVQPFASDSIWNMPIGTGAQYVAINMAPNPSASIWTPMPQIDDEYLFLDASAPLTSINFSSAGWSGSNRCNATGGLLVQVPFPAAYLVPNSLGNNAAAFLMADQRTIIQTQPITRCVAGGPATSLVTFTGVDLYGDGRYGAHGGSGLSAIGGSIRVGEFRPGKPVQHAIKIDVDTPVVLARCSTASDCFRWPAFAADSGAAGSYGTQNSNPVPGMKMGALLAIPTSTNINALGLESVPGQMLAWTLQNYGAYIVDSTGGPGFVIGAETGPNGSLRDQFQADFGMALEERVNDNTPWSRDMQRLIQALYLVDNNSPTSIGGGGTPLQPLAPPLQLPGVADTIPPTVPGGLSASASPSKINLSWTASTDNVGVTGYKIFRNGAQVATASSPAYADAGLLALTLYSYTVAAFDAAGNTSAQSAALSVSTLAAPDTQAPSVPAGLTATAVSPTQINLSWTASTDNVGVTGYRVYRAGTLLATLGAVTGYQNTGLAASTTYSYTVQAVDAAGNASAQSASASATTQAAPDTTAPTTPAAVSASAVSSSQINLSWTASTDNVGVTGYRIYRAGTLLTTLGAVTAFQNTGLAASTTYSYTVQAVDAAGNASAQSASASATTQTGPDTTPPSVPTGLTGKAVSPTRISLTWKASTDNVGVAGYNVYLNDVALATTKTRSFTQSGLTAGTTYNYRVSAFDAAGNTSASTAPVAVTTPLSRVIGSDFNGDHKSDILWRNSATGENTIWLMNGATISATVSSNALADLNYSIVGVGDFNGNGQSDILWHNSATGENAIWLMNGTALSSGAVFATITDPNWSVAGVGDFDGNGKSDIVWRNSATGQNVIYLMNGATVASSAALATVADPNWSIAGVGDFNGDGKSDILWRNSATGENAIWFMNGPTLSANSPVGGLDLNWTIAGVGDFDGDGKFDILWHNSTTGENAIWLMNGATLLGGAVFATITDTNWVIAGIGDVDGDGRSDILWHNSATGENQIYLMNGASVSSSSAITTQAGGWSAILR